MTTACTKMKLANSDKPATVAQVEAMASVRISASTPSSGALSGGTIITITGENFFSGIQVTVGGQPCGNVTVVSASLMTCAVPAGGSGAADIALTVSQGTPVVLAGGFTYIEAPAPVAGFAISAGGAISVGPDLLVHATAGEPLNAPVQTASGMTVLSGFSGAIYH